MPLKRLFIAMIILFIPTLIAMIVIDEELKMSTAPYGIISLELCGYSDSCITVLDGWGNDGKKLAMLSLGLDYLYLILYPSLTCLALLLILPYLAIKLQRMTQIIAWISLLCIPLDAFENYFLIKIVLGSSAPLYSKLGAAFAITKFAVFGISIIWLFSCGIFVFLIQKQKIGRIM